MSTHLCGYAAQYQTDKTDTTEFVIGSEFGIASFKVVRTANGKRVNVYSGFEPSTWKMDGTLPKMGQDTFWEHQYLNKLDKAVAKWAGRKDDIGPEPVQGFWPILERFDEDGAACLASALLDDDKVGSHWRMIIGDETPVTSNVKATEKKAVFREKVASIHETRMASDTGYGIF